MRSVMSLLNDYYHPYRRKPKDQLKIGIKTEMEHRGLNKKIVNYEERHDKVPSNKWVAERIAKAHLKEDPKYYTKLKRARL